MALNKHNFLTMALGTLLIASAAAAHAKTVVSVFAEGTPLADVQVQCKDLVIVTIDTHFECHTKAADNFESITADMRRHDISSDPVQAGQEGNRSALRHLPDVSQDSTNAGNAYISSLVARYEALDQSVLSGEPLLNAQLLGYVLGQKSMLAEFDTSRMPFTNDSGFFNMMSYVSRQTKFVTIDDYEAYAARLSELPRYFKQHKTNMRRGIATGYTASSEILPGIMDGVNGLAGGAPEEHSFYKPFLTFPDTISETEQERLAALGLDVMTRDVLPAYADLSTFFTDEYGPSARTQVGIGSTAEGRKHYEALVRYYTTLDITPDEVHELGLSEVKRIRSEMDAIIKETGFEGSFKEFLVFMRTDEQFYAKTPEELLKEAAWISKRIDGVMPRYFGKLPRLPYGVMAVPDEIAPNYTTGRYWGGSIENGVSGNFMVNTYDLSQRPLYNLPALALHEGVPGHHHQISLAQEQKDVPTFRQSLYPNAFGEGWGLYSEKLGVEMGIYQTPYEQFGRLTYEMWRACRLVVDTGMHWKGWSREQAEACFFDNSALAPHNIRTEVERYISWPGQALSYKMGELKILELRGKAEKELGEEFDIRGFHDAVLSNGGVPLGILETQIDTWIAETKTQK